jgi:hypothetical protein
MSTNRWTVLWMSTKERSTSQFSLSVDFRPGRHLIMYDSKTLKFASDQSESCLKKACCLYFNFNLINLSKGSAALHTYWLGDRIMINILGDFDHNQSVIPFVYKLLFSESKPPIYVFNNFVKNIFRILTLARSFTAVK